MLQNYFFTAYRNLIRNKSFASTSVLGLTIGIASCVLLFLVIQFESGFDAFHKKKDRIYRVVSIFDRAGTLDYSSGVPIPLGDAIRSEFSQLETVSFMAIQRVKEVGIRKVLGASVKSIVYLFSKEFTLLVLIAFLIASPLAYVFMHQWLDNFAFKIELGIKFFLLAFAGAIFTAWITVGYKAVKAAFANPVKSLRTE